MGWDYVFDLCGDSELAAVLKDQDIVDLHPEDGGENDKVVHGRERRSALPLVDGLGRSEAENILHTSLTVRPARIRNRVMFIPVAVMSMTGI